MTPAGGPLVAPTAATVRTDGPVREPAVSLAQLRTRLVWTVKRTLRAVLEFRTTAAR